MTGAPPPDPTASSLGQRAVRGTVWLTSANYAGFVVNMLANLVVMRILSRSDVGVYVLGFAVNEFVALLGSHSLELAVIHLRDEDDGTLFDTAYILYLAIGLLSVLVSLVTFLVLGLFDPFTWDVRLVVVILGMLRPLTLLSSIAAARIETEFRYGALSLNMLAATSLPSFAALGLAAVGAGPFALVARDVLVAVFSYIVYGTASRWRCGWRWSRGTARRLLRYSNPMFATRVLEVLMQRFDRLLIGSMIGKDQLGSYHNGRYLAEMGYTLVLPVLRLSFNVYSRVREDMERLRRAWQLVNYFILRAAVLLTIVLALVPKDVVVVMFGAKWLPAVPTARILAPYAGMLPVFANMVQLLYGRGMMRQSVVLRSIQVAVFVPGVLIAARLGGVDAIGWALLVTMLVGFAVMVRDLGAVVSASLREMLLAPAAAAAAAAASALLLVPMLAGETLGLSLARLALVSAVYAGTLVVIDRRPMLDHYRYLRKMFARP